MAGKRDQDFHLKALFHVGGMTDSVEHRSTVHLVFSCGERVLSRKQKSEFAYPSSPLGWGKS